MRIATQATINRRLAQGRPLVEAMFGREKPVPQHIAEVIGIGGLYQSRVRRGVDPERAAQRAPMHRNDPQSLSAMCRRVGIQPSTVYYKAKREGITTREALVQLCRYRLKKLGVEQ